MSPLFLLLITLLPLGKTQMEKIIDLVIEEKSGEWIEFPGLYDKLSDGIPQKSTLKTAAYLELIGFDYISGGRGNYPPYGPRIVSKTYRKSGCKCQVSLIYYST